MSSSAPRPLITSSGCYMQPSKHHGCSHAQSPASKASGASSSGQVVLWGPADQEEGSELLCDERDENCALARAPSSGPASECEWSPSRSYGWSSSGPSELQETLTRLMARERELQLSPADYLAAPPPSPPAAAPGVTPQMRCIVASWLSEVAGEFRLQQETLFLGVRILDQFLAASQAGIPRNVLQLVAVACIMVASKQDEVSHPSVDDFTEIAADAFQRGDLLRMERLLLDQVEWRVTSPTAYTFLHVLTQVLAGRLSKRAIALSAYLAELSLLDYGLLQHPPSLIAASALAAGAAWHGGGGAADALEAATGYSAAELGACGARLLHLMQCAAAADLVPAYQPLAFVRDKYAQEPWLCISRTDAGGAAFDAVAAHLGAWAAAPARQP